MRWTQVALIFSLVMLGPGCGKPAAKIDQAAASLIETIPSDRWKGLAERKLFFAHKSIGYNILEGVKDLGQANPEIAVRLAETRNPADFDTPVLAHSQNGVNGDPVGKIAAFRESIDSGLGAKLDIAFLKFCFVDFEADTDVPKVFAEYKKTMADLKARYPNMTVVHLTVPLTVVQSGPKAWVKQVLGKPVFGVDQNLAKDQFNKLMRLEYEGKEPLFDLAAWESTMPDGARKEFTVNGRSYHELSDQYASDAGHLNTEGRRWVAAHLLVFLASLPPSQGASTASLQ